MLRKSQYRRNAFRCSFYVVFLLISFDHSNSIIIFLQIIIAIYFCSLCLASCFYFYYLYDYFSLFLTFKNI